MRGKHLKCLMGSLAFCPVFVNFYSCFDVVAHSSTVRALWAMICRAVGFHTVRGSTTCKGLRPSEPAVPGFLSWLFHEMDG